MKPKKQADLSKKITSYSTHPVWTRIASTIKLLQKSRSALKTDKNFVQLHHRRCGINSSIILLSATCIEGFLVECLLSFTLGYKFATKQTLQERMNHDLLQRISTATFAEFKDLFALTLGHPLDELIKDEKMLEAVRILISFRNGLAHGRSISYETYEDPALNDDIEYDMQSQYKRVYEYLCKINLVFRHENILKDEVADHFASVIFPYMDEVLKVLPPIQSDTVKDLVRWAKDDAPL